ncbi:MAG: putative polymerase, sigma 70 family subunit [Myxococcales bacterium]|nr:putative polymerase, sigma 70 family subunit [Myxococcales bacterium]
MAKKPKRVASNRDAEVVDGELVEADDAVDVEPGEPDAAELSDEDVPAEVEAPAPVDDDEPAADPDAPHALVPATPRSRSLARLDPMQLYIQDIRRYPLLSREDEHALAVKYAETGDVEAARRLVTSNLRLVVKIAHEYRRAHRNLLDLIQEGNVGLVQAVKKYDPYRGVKLSSYAAWWIRAYMLKFILNNWRLVKIGTTQAQRKLFFNLKKEKDKLEALGVDSSSAALAETLQVPEREVIDMERRLGQGEMSLDAPLGKDDDSGRSHLDMLESGGDMRPDVRAEGDEFRGMLRAKLETFAGTLRGRELTIFQERLLTDSPKTLQEIGETYGISRERARQLEKRLTDKLKKYLQAELGDAVQIAMGIED